MCIFTDEPGFYLVLPILSNRIAHFKAHDCLFMSRLNVHIDCFPSQLIDMKNNTKNDNQQEYRIVSAANGDKTIKVWVITIDKLSASSSPFVSVSCERIIKIDAVFSVVALRDGRRIASGSGKCIHLWNGSTGELEGSLDGHGDIIPALIQLRNGNLASGSYDRSIRIWDIGKGECIRNLESNFRFQCLLELHDGRIASASFSGSEHGVINIWNIQDNSQKLFTSRNSYIDSLIQLSNGRLIACNYNFLMICNLETSKFCGVFQGSFKPHWKGLHRCTARLPNNRIVSCSTNGSMALWKKE